MKLHSFLSILGALVLATILSVSSAKSYELDICSMEDHLAVSGAVISQGYSADQADILTGIYHAQAVIQLNLLYNGPTPSLEGLTATDHSRQLLVLYINSLFEDYHDYLQVISLVYNDIKHCNPQGGV